MLSLDPLALNEREGPLSLDTTKDKYNRGSGSSSSCPRSGAVILETRKGLTEEVTTNCNTWRCVGCRNRNLKRFKGIVSSGCLTLGRCSFITITYKAGSERLEDVACVQKDWTALMRRLRKASPWISQMEYLRVTELTKKGTPHIHAIFGTIPAEKLINCWKTGEFHVQRFVADMAVCNCFSHEMAREWSKVTKGESYICFGIAVTSARGAGAYLGKYMGKEMFETEGRRFQKSNGWPSEKRRRVKAGPGGFRRVIWTPGAGPRELQGKWDKIPRSGTERQIAAAKKDAAARLLKIGEIL